MNENDHNELLVLLPAFLCKYAEKGNLLWSWLTRLCKDRITGSLVDSYSMTIFVCDYEFIPPSLLSRSISGTVHSSRCYMRSFSGAGGKDAIPMSIESHRTVLIITDGNGDSSGCGFGRGLQCSLFIQSASATFTSGP